MEFREATMDDAEMLLRWRNDPLTREMSFNGAETSMEDHRTWLEWKLSNPFCEIIIATNDAGVPVGAMRADGDETHVVLNWVVAPEHRGQGYAFSMIRCSLARYHKHRVKAVIKPTNVASIRSAERAGMVASHIVYESASPAKTA